MDPNTMEDNLKRLRIAISAKDGGGIVLGGSAVVARKLVLFAGEMKRESLATRKESHSLKARLSDTLPENDLPGLWLPDTDTIRCNLHFVYCFLRSTYVVKGWNS